MFATLHNLHSSFAAARAGPSVNPQRGSYEFMSGCRIHEPQRRKRGLSI